MRTLDAPEAYGSTIFCDDIRNEVGGKFTYVGAYSSGMFVHGTFPVALPKFAFGIHFAQRSDLYVPEINVRIFLPGEEEEAAIEFAIAAEEGLRRKKEAQAAPKIDTPGDHRYIMNTFNIPVAPLIIQTAGLIKVRAVRNNEMVRLGSLQVMQAPIPTPSPDISTQ